MQRFLKCAAVLLLVASAFAQNKVPAWRNGAQEKGCGLGTYHDALTLAFANATRDKGETLATLQVLPSFQRETAFIFKRVGNEINLIQATFQDQLWAQLQVFVVRRTRQECLALAEAAKLVVIEVPVPSGDAEALWNVFLRTNLRADDCPRDSKGHCAHFIDGTSYFVETGDGLRLKLTEIGDDRRIASENPALLAWVREVLLKAKASHRVSS